MAEKEKQKQLTSGGSRKNKIEVQYNDKGVAMCSAKRSSWTPENPRICTTTAIYSNSRCRMHGGPTPGGISSPHFVTGASSKHLPTRLIGKYQEALEDPTLMGLMTDIAMVETRINDLHEQLDQGGAGKIMVEVNDAMESFQYASQDNDRKAMRESWRRLEDAVKRGKGEASVWGELFDMRDQKRKLVLAESKRLQTMDQMVKVTQVNLLVSALLDAVRQHVTDRKILAKVSESFTRIMSGPTSS